MAEARQAVHPVPALGLHTHRVDTSCHSFQLAMTQGPAPGGKGSFL